MRGALRRRFATGVKIVSLLGINLSARTGYSSGAKVKTKNTSKSTRQICGTNGYYGDTPGRVMLK